MCRRALALVGGAVVLVSAATGACSRTDAEPRTSTRYPDITCQVGFLPDPQRTARVMALLRRDPEGGALLDRTPGPHTVCYGPVEQPALDVERRLQLRADASDQAAAAGIAHLLQHIADRFPPPIEQQPPECDRWLEQVRDHETRAHHLENRVRARLGLPPLATQTLERGIDRYEARCLSESRSGARPTPTRDGG